MTCDHVKEDHCDIEQTPDIPPKQTPTAIADSINKKDLVRDSNIDTSLDHHISSADSSPSSRPSMSAIDPIKFDEIVNARKRKSQLSVHYRSIEGPRASRETVGSSRETGLNRDSFGPIASINSTSSFRRKLRGNEEARALIARLQNSEASTIRLFLASVLYSTFLEVLIGCVTISNFFLVCLEADIQANGGETPFSLAVVNWCCLGIFTVELCTRIFVERLNIFQSYWNIFDMIIVCLGIIGEVLMASSTFSVVRMFRCARLVRVVKAASLMSNLKEMRALIRGIISCGRTLFWSTLLLFFVMTIFSTIAVIMIHPLMKDVALTGVWDECDRCARSFRSVMGANLTFFQTIVSGDSWGKIAIPLIEHAPWTAVILLGAYFTVVFGVLNLMIAVLVDTASEARAEDSSTKAKERDRAERREKRDLGKIFQDMDVDSSGALTFEELLDGAQTLPTFSTRLRAMDISDDDLLELFRMLDEDNSGEIDPDEFIQSLYRMKCGETKTATSFVKHYAARISKEQALLSTKMQSMLVDITTRMASMVDEHSSNHSALLLRIARLERKLAENLATVMDLKENATTMRPIDERSDASMGSPANGVTLGEYADSGHDRSMILNMQGAASLSQVEALGVNCESEAKAVTAEPVLSIESNVKEVWIPPTAPPTDSNMNDVEIPLTASPSGLAAMKWHPARGSNGDDAEGEEIEEE